jgi:hypothetical protein
MQNSIRFGLLDYDTRLYLDYLLRYQAISKTQTTQSLLITKSLPNLRISRSKTDNRSPLFLHTVVTHLKLA